MATLFGVAILYTLLNASFLAVVQVVVYIGAIAILFIFAVMLTRVRPRKRALGQHELVGGRTAGGVDFRGAVFPAPELERLLEAGSSHPVGV